MRILNFLMMSILVFVPRGGSREGTEPMRSAADSIEKVVSESGIEAAVVTFHELKSDSGAAYAFDEAQFNGLGYRLISKGMIKEAIEVFRMNVELFPDSANVYDSLGEGYMLNGDKDSAVVYYKKAFEMDPENWLADMNVKRMDGFIDDADRGRKKMPGKGLSIGISF